MRTYSGIRAGMGLAHRRWPMVVRSTGVMCLLLWGLALPRPATATASERSVVVGPAQRPVLRVSPVGPIDEMDPRLLRDLELREQTRRMVHEWLGPHGISAKGIERGRQRRDAISSKGFAAADGPDTLDVLVILIDFENDRSGSLTSVTEDGGLSCDPDPDIAIDPPPHNRDYFGAHIEGLSRYWSSMSRGRLHVNARVIPSSNPADPRAPCDAFSLSDIADYGPGSGGFWNIDQLVRLVQDMILKADEETLDDPSINLADYDFDNPNTYLIFAHAGADLQSNIVWTEGHPDYSPNDIPTFFVQLGDDDRVPLQSVDSTTGNMGLVTECSVIPETTSQDGLVGSIAAALYHEFGHALGLPDLYSTYTGLPTVGWWELMDSGTNLPAVVQFEAGGEPLQVTGLLPPSIGIWCKWFLGWIDPIRVGSAEEFVRLPASYLQSRDDKAVLLDTGSDEFFLVENRWIPPFVPTTGVGSPAWALIRDQATRVALYLGLNQDVDRPPNTHLYDFFMPWAGGAMVWRVRQDLIDQRLPTNEVQGVPGDWALEIIEADGLQDIGIFDFRTFGFVGSDNDAFRKEATYRDRNSDPVFEVSFDSTATFLASEGRPSTYSALRVPTGAELWEISRSDTLMTLRAAVNASPVTDASEFPVVLPVVDGVPFKGDARSVSHLAGLTASGGGDNAILVSAALADSNGGAAIYAYDPATGRPAVAGDGKLADISAPTAGPIAYLPSFRGTRAFALMTISGAVYVQQADLASGAPIFPGFPVDLADTLTHGPTVVPRGSEFLLVGANLLNSRLHIVQEDGSVRDDWSDWEDGLGLSPGDTLRSAPVAADLDGNGTPESMVFFAGDNLLGYDLSGALPVQVLSVGVGKLIPPISTGALLELTVWPPDTGSGRDAILILFNESVVQGPDTAFLLVEYLNGAWQVDFFAELLPRAPTGPLALGDLDGDGRRDIVVLDPERIWAFSGAEGAMITGFPIPLEDQYLVSINSREVDEPQGSAVILDIDGNGSNEIVFESMLGLLYAIDKTGRNLPGFPRKVSGGNVASPQLIDYLADSVPRRALLLYEAEGDTVTAGGAVRSARLHKIEVAPPSEPRPESRLAEWHGLGGSVLREGRAVEGLVVGESGTASLETFEAFIYPNPAGAQLLARARFYSGGPQTARATLMNVEGQERYTTTKQIDSEGVGEIDLPIETLAAGPYVCRLEYLGPSGPTVDVIPFYIVN